jgi:hypothetical protein
MFFNREGHLTFGKLLRTYVTFTFLLLRQRKVTKEKAALRHAAPPGSGATLRGMLSDAAR